MITFIHITHLCVVDAEGQKEIAIPLLSARLQMLLPFSHLMFRKFRFISKSLYHYK